MNDQTMPPLIGVTPDRLEDRIQVRPSYLEAVRNSGGLPVVLSGDPADIPAILRRMDGFVFTGGDDPIMESFGEATHPEACRIDPRRQTFELALLAALDDHASVPVLGVCLGMQLMGLHAGGRLDQHLPDTLSTAADHADGTPHPIEGPLGTGIVWSRHRQAITDPGSLEVVARAGDGVIEAIADPDRPMYLGVQWHPERTDDPVLGADLFRRLVDRARGDGG
ncbi:MAG: type 1 glutamine amidotransferase [Planctomycetota bacterium]|nr:type 1 glutamine amidotransferase [Planctomycetota bacterium]